jgi:hypothetical protein
MSIRITLLMVMVTLLLTGVSFANPAPWPGTDNQFTIMQTVEFTFHIEGSIQPDTMGTWILYGGPTLVNILSPAETKGTGFGIEMGAELRKYFMRPLSGLFAGAYLGAGALWRSGEEQVEAVSAGVKLGWRIPLFSRGLQLDVEPYICVGAKLLGSNKDENSDLLDAALYLGTKFDFY